MLLDPIVDISDRLKGRFRRPKKELATPDLMELITAAEAEAFGQTRKMPAAIPASVVAWDGSHRKEPGGHGF